MHLLPSSRRRAGPAVAVLLAAAAVLLAATACARTSAEEPGATSSSIGVKDRGEVFFPRYDGPVPAIGSPGRLFEDEAGCIRLDIFKDDVTPTVLWPDTWSAERGEDSRVRVMDEEGRILARTGDEVDVGGMVFGTPLEENPGVEERTKEELRQRCPGRYYFAGSLSPPGQRDRSFKQGRRHGPPKTAGPQYQPPEGPYTP